MTTLDALRLRAWSTVAIVATALSVIGACGLHASRQRSVATRSDEGLRAIARHLPAPDVAFTGGARWLRAISVEEPGAAQADGIAFPDPEPGAGAVVAPRRAWAEAWERR